MEYKYDLSCAEIREGSGAAVALEGRLVAPREAIKLDD